MSEKNDFALDLLRQGKTNISILDAVKTEFGKGISTSLLAKMRQGLRAETAVVVPRSEVYDYARKLLLVEGMTRHAVQQACRAKLGRAPSYRTMTRWLEEHKAVPNDNPITEIALPTEVVEEEPSFLPAPVDPVVPSVEPNGSLESFKTAQAWMHRVGAQSLTLTAEGKLSVLVLHELDIGDLS